MSSPHDRPPTAIEVDGLVKTYGEVRALDGLSFGVASGTVTALLGPNGAGKSTAVRVLTTTSRPDAGQARVGGLDVVAEPARVRRVLGCVAQRSGVDPEATGRENLALQGRVHGLRGRALRQRVDALLERLGLAEAADRVTKGWSGGMQRRLDLAMGLVHGPRILFLDEPTTGLDPEGRADLWAELDRLRADEGLTLLLTTHYLEEADRLADEVVIVDHGRVVTSGTPSALKAGLRGDAVVVGLREPGADGAAVRALADLPGLREPSLDGQVLRARADDGAAAVPGVLAALDRAGVPAATVTVARPSLDDVYLAHTGRSLTEDPR